MSDNNSEAHYNPPPIVIDHYGITEQQHISFSIACKRRASKGKVKSYMKMVIQELASWIDRHNQKLPCIVLTDWNRDEQNKIHDLATKEGYKSDHEYITASIRDKLKEAI